MVGFPQIPWFWRQVKLGRITPCLAQFSATNLKTSFWRRTERTETLSSKPTNSQQSCCWKRMFVHSLGTQSCLFNLENVAVFWPAQVKMQKRHLTKRKANFVWKAFAHLSLALENGWRQQISSQMGYYNSSGRKLLHPLWRKWEEMWQDRNSLFSELCLYNNCGL